MIRTCDSPTTVPIISESSEHTSRRACHTFTVMSPNVSPRPSVSELTVSSNTKIEILGITVSQVVTIVGVPSYTSGAQ